MYKHALLHGLNISAALATAAVAAAPAPAPAFAPKGAAISLPQTRTFRLFSVRLNAAYVLECFLRTLVKRRMRSMNALLMAASMAVALPVL